MKKLAFLLTGLLILFVTGCGGGTKAKTTFSPTSPEGVTQAYYQALKDGKADAAYQYRKFDPPKTKEQFVQERQSAGMTFKDFSIGKGQIQGTLAVVPVTFKTGDSAMPEFTMSIQLVKEQSWLIANTGVGTQTEAATGGSETGTAPPADGANPHGTGGSIPLNK